MTYYERKALLPHGAVSRVAEDASCAISKVSAVLAGHVRDRSVETLLARYMRTSKGGRVSVTEAFGHPMRKVHRKGSMAAAVA